MSTIKTLDKLLKGDLWHYSGTKRGVRKYITQDSVSPYVFYCLDLSHSDYKGEVCYRFLFYKFIVSPESIYSGDCSLMGYDNFYMIGKECIEEGSATSFDASFAGYDDSDDPEDIFLFVSKFVKEKFDADPLLVLNKQLFLNYKDNEGILYPLPSYPGGKPDKLKGNYRKAAKGRRDLIFVLFYLMADLDNAMYWLNDMLTNLEYRDSRYIKSLHEWADVALAELSEGKFREVLLPKWASIKMYTPHKVG